THTHTHTLTAYCADRNNAPIQTPWMDKHISPKTHTHTNVTNTHIGTKAHNLNPHTHSLGAVCVIARVTLRSCVHSHLTHTHTHTHTNTHTHTHTVRSLRASFKSHLTRCPVCCLYLLTKMCYGKNQNKTETLKTTSVC